MQINIEALAELLKQAKKALAREDQSSAEMYVEMLWKRAGQMLGLASQPLALPSQQIIQYAAQVATKPISQLGDEPLSAEELTALKATDAKNVIDQRAAAHERMYDKIKKVFDGGNWQQTDKGLCLAVSIPREWGSVSEIEHYLKQRGLVFSSLDRGLFPLAPGVNPREWILTFTR